MSGFAQGVIAGGIAVFLAAQFIAPVRTNPPFTQGYTLESTARVPPEVESILSRSCEDCHSTRRSGRGTVTSHPCRGLFQVMWHRGGDT